jgi:hypothetical protein
MFDSLTFVNAGIGAVIGAVSSEYTMERQVSH